MRKTIGLLCVLVLIVLVLLPAEKDVCDMAVTFNGAGDAINFGPYSATGNLSQKTIMAWVYINSFSSDNDNTDYIVSQYNSTDGGWGFWSGRQIAGETTTYPFSFFETLDVSVGSWIYYSTDSTVNTWVHYAVSYDNTSSDNDPTMYINGAEVADTENIAPSGSAIDASAASLVVGNLQEIGAVNYPYPMLGNIQDVRIYDRILSSDEIREIYSSRLIMDSIPGGVFHCPMIDLTGAVDSDDYTFDVWTGVTGSIVGTLIGIPDTIQTYGGK